MCFENNINELNKARSQRKSITVWKNTDLDEKTGLAVSHYNHKQNDKVWWKKGTVVKPHKIRQPLKNGEKASAGLYFYTSKGRAWGEPTVKASVKPKDIIAVQRDGETICAVAATVIDAPNPDPRRQHIKWLNEKIREAKDKIEANDRRNKVWMEERDDNIEALEAMLAETKQLKGSKRI